MFRQSAESAPAAKHFRYGLSLPAKRWSPGRFRSFIRIGRKKLTFTADEPAVFIDSRGFVYRHINHQRVGPNTAHCGVLHPGHRFGGISDGLQINRKKGFTCSSGLHCFL